VAVGAETDEIIVRLERRASGVDFYGLEEIEVAGEACSALEAIGMLFESRADVVLMDLTMPDLSAWEATRRIKEIAPGVAVVIVPLSEDQPMLFRCLNAGAAGYVRSSDLPVQLKSAIQTAYRSSAHAA